MKCLGVPLFPHEKQALIDALRKDLKRETRHWEKRCEWSGYHHYNIRLNMRLLELLEPMLSKDHN